jgi:hypothetical protein
MKASKAVEIFSGMNPDDEVWITYVTKGDVEENFLDFALEDEQGNLIDIEPFVTNDTVERVTFSLDNDDYLWERFNECFRDSCNEVLCELIEEKKEAEEDKELWDTEGVTDEGERTITTT